MAYEQTVLSLNPDGHTLLSQEAALRENGFEVISVSSPMQARFEIEMGRCGILMTSHITPVSIFSDLVSLFRRSCPPGLVVYVASHPEDDIPDADLVLSDEDEPQVMIHKIRVEKAKKTS
jgi:hypothetical protein